MAMYKQGVIQPLVSFLGVEILTTFWFLWHNVDPDMLESQSRALKSRGIA